MFVYAYAWAFKIFMGRTDAEANLMPKQTDAKEDGKESACSAGDLGLVPELGRLPWRKAWQPTPVFLPGESHGWRILSGYSPWGHK